MDSKEIVQVLRTKGYRVTPTREGIIEILLRSERPLSAVTVLERLSKEKIKVNKTTVYRELAFLLEKNITREVHVSSGIIHYESNYLPHHHHLMCTNCGSIKEIESNDIEKAVDNLTKSISSSGFQIKKHNLEFYGMCMNCQ